MRISICGVGHWHAGMHADAVRGAGAELASVWDEDASVADGFAARHRAVARRSVAAVLAERPDFVIALGRGPQAAGLLAELLEYDVPLLADKPLGLTAGDVAPLVETAARKKRFVAVALANRVSPVYAELAGLRAAGRVGAISNMQMRLINGPPQRYRDWGVGWMLDRRASGGGALRNLGLHGLDAFAALAGGQDVTVQHAAFGRGVYGEAVEDYALVVLRAADGMLGIVEAGYTNADPRRGVYEFRLDGIGASLADNGATLSVATAEGTQQRDSIPTSRRYTEFLADTLARLRDGRAPAVTLDDFMRAMVLADRATEMAGRA